MAQRLRVGIISAAWGVTAHLPAWRSLDGVDVTAICTSRPETAAKAAREHGFARAFHDFREMAADPDIDIIDCGTRPPLRYEMVMAALNAGKHVYQGIPFAADLASAEAMTARRFEVGTVAAVDAFMQTVPALVLLKRMIDDGSLGEIHGFRAKIDLTLFTAQRINAKGYTWFADPDQGASVMRNNGSHVLNLLVHLFGPVAEVLSDQAIRLRRWGDLDGSAIEPQVPDTAFNLLRFTSGLSGQMSMVWTMPDAPGFELEVWGDKARAVVRAPGFPQAYDTRLFLGGIARMGERTETEIALPESLRTLPRSRARADDPQMGVFPMAAIFSSMLDEIEGVGQAAPNFAQALHVQRVVEAAQLSSQERRWESIASD